MANIQYPVLSASENPGYIHAGNISQPAADKVSELLRTNHEKYHILFNRMGLHNHIVHHLLAIYAIGATPEDLQKAWDLNVPYQLQIEPVLLDPIPAEDPLDDLNIFRSYVGQHERYGDFVRFFTAEVARQGVEKTVNRYLFAGDELADDLLARLFDGFLHPLIHLGYGIEFKQPALVVEALAQAAITEFWIGDILKPAIEARKKQRAQYQNLSKSLGDPTLISLYDRIHADPAVAEAVRLDSPPSKLPHNVIPNAGKVILPYLLEYAAEPDQLKEKSIELVNSSIYVAAAAQKPGKVAMFDFVLIHAANSSIWLPLLVDQDWISHENKARLLELKAWADLTGYTISSCPALYPDRIVHYKQKKPGDWDSVFQRAAKYNDDGHTAKLVRAAYAAGQLSEEFVGTPGFLLHSDHSLQVAHMALDSVDQMNEPDYKLPDQETYATHFHQELQRIIFRWVRWAGAEGAWDYIPDLTTTA